VRRSAFACLALALAVAGCSKGSTSPGVTAGPGATTAPTAQEPWPAPVSDVTARAQSAGLPILAAEAFAQHIHAHLDVFVNGQAVTVPANIGIDYVSSHITPLHTHDSSGVIHIESPDMRTYTLGQLFTEWGVKLSAGCVATYCAPATPVVIEVNGVSSTGDPSTLIIHLHDEFAVVIGTPPPAVPSAFSFPAGY
jgi:hypothetical protein